MFVNCKEVIELSSRALDSRLSWRDVLKMRLHFLVCTGCRRYHAQLRIIRRIMRNLAESVGADRHAESLSDGARLRIERTLRERRRDESAPGR